jgi:hypothetical protein
MKKLIISIFVLLISVFQANSIIAQPFEPPVIIDPPHPMVGDTIRVGVFEEFYPPCLILPGQNQDGLTHLFEFEDNNIELFVVNSLTPPICNPFPVTPAPREYYELGVLDEGIYSLNTFIVGVATTLPILDGSPFPSNFGQQVIFQVSTPKVIDTFTNLGTLILTLIILMIANIFCQKHSHNQ